MGLLQKAVETYDAMASRLGEDYAEEREPLAPIFHIPVQAQIEITLDQDGRLLSARAVDTNESKIIIPVTEESAGRTKAPCAHPLCDHLGYLAPYDEEKHSLYVNALSAWEQSPCTHPKLRPILHYVQGGTILSDLAEAGLIQFTEAGKPADEKLLVRWVVNGLEDGEKSECWRDRSLMKAFVDYCSFRQADAAPALCMITGAMEPPAAQHPKGIVPLNGNAKLISFNDSHGFTYRGRFDSASQAATVSRIASQKAHCALRWLVSNQGVNFGKRMFLCWNPKGHEVPAPYGPMMLPNAAQPAANPTQYRQQLQKALSGWKERLPGEEGVVIAAFDAATTGRLAVTCYNELRVSDFLDRLHAWEESCYWKNGPYGIQSPSLFQIVNLAFGTPRGGKVQMDKQLLSQQMQRLIVCRIEQAAFPADIEKKLVDRASNLLIYTAQNLQETQKLRGKLLFTACAVIRRYHIDYKEEHWDMALNNDCKDRSYLFGRLLAIAEIVERIALIRKGALRETNALRMQRAFVLRPMSTWQTLEGKLEPYYSQLSFGQANYYRNITQEILDKIEVPTDEKELKEMRSELNSKLDDIYLLGYYHQRAYRSQDAEKQETKESGG